MYLPDTVDSLTTIRKLKEHGVEVFFEKEAIWTFDSKGELLITIMSSLAQEESRSISENVTWGVRKRFADGKVSLGYSSFLGYSKGPDGELVINPEESKTVVLIYRMYMEGKTSGTIANHLTALGIPTPGGKSQWRISTVESILKNEKYKGDALLQKSFTVDFLSKKSKMNEGEIPQYYVEGNHEPIITPEEFDLVQVEIGRRKKISLSYRSVSVFSTKLVCADCGGLYGPKVWHSNDKYRRAIWRCNDKFKGDQKCATTVLGEDQIKSMFMVAYAELASKRSQIAADSKAMLELLTDCTGIDGEIKAADQAISELETLIRAEILGHADHPISQEKFDARYEELQERYTSAEARRDDLKNQRKERIERRRKLSKFLSDLQTSDPTELWDDRLWQMLVEKAIIHRDGGIDFIFYNGKTIHVEQDAITR